MRGIRLYAIVAAAFMAGAFLSSPELRVYAANTVGSADIINNSILSADIKDGEVKTVDLGGNAVTSAKIKDGEVKTADIATGAVAAGRIADGAVGTLKIADDSIMAVDIQANAVGTSEIAAGAVTLAKLGSDVPKDIVNQIVGAGSEVVSPGQTKTITAVCPSGMRATGGGFEATGGILDVLSEIPSINAWSVTAINSGPASPKLIVYVVCLKLTP